MPQIATPTIIPTRGPTLTASCSRDYRSGSSGLSTRPKAEIATGTAVLVIIIGAIFIWKGRPNRRQAQRLMVLPNHANDYDEEQKAELSGTQREERALNRPVLLMSELPEEGSRVAVAEIEQKDRSLAVNELDVGKDIHHDEEKAIDPAGFTVTELRHRKGQPVVEELDGEGGRHERTTLPLAKTMPSYLVHCTIPLRKLAHYQRLQASIHLHNLKQWKTNKRRPKYNSKNGDFENGER